MERFLGRVGRGCALNGERVLANVLRTCREMLIDRGFAEMEAEGGREAVGEGEPALVARGEGGVAYVYVLIDEKIGVKVMRAILRRHEEEEGACIVVVSESGPTHITRKEAVGISFMTVATSKT